MKDNLNYDIDGVVVSVNELDLRSILGYTNSSFVIITSPRISKDPISFIDNGILFIVFACSVTFSPISPFPLVDAFINSHFKKFSHAKSRRCCSR